MECIAGIIKVDHGIVVDSLRERVRERVHVHVHKYTYIPCNVFYDSNIIDGVGTKFTDITSRLWVKVVRLFL